MLTPKNNLASILKSERTFRLIIIYFLVIQFILPVSSVLTKSYLVYLYNRYVEELNVHRKMVESSCKQWGHIRHRYTLIIYFNIDLQ